MTLQRVISTQENRASEYEWKRIQKQLDDNDLKSDKKHIPIKQRYYILKKIYIWISNFDNEKRPSDRPFWFWKINDKPHIPDSQALTKNVYILLYSSFVTCNITHTLGRY